MPAELFVTTPERTLFQYLAKPLTRSRAERCENLENGSRNE